MAAGPHRTYVPPRDLWRALDGHFLRLSGRRWRVEVYGVCDDGERRWIQLSLSGRTRHMLTLRLTAGDGAPRAALALASWLAHPTEATDVLSTGSVAGTAGRAAGQ